MLKRTSNSCFIALTLLAFATGKSAQARPKQVRPKANGPVVQQPKPTPQERNMLGMPAGWVERLQKMTPEQRERFLSNNARFQALPAQRQAQIRQRLEAVDKMSPQQKEAFEQREQVWNQMPPDQQRYVRDTLLPEWQHMAPRRKMVLLQKLRNLRGLDDDQRGAKLNDEAFLGGLDQNERKMLRDLANLRVGTPDAPDEATP